MPAAARPDVRCPVCGAAPTPSHRPFCGQGCRDRDLLRWLGDGHRLPGPPLDPEDFNGLDSPADPRL